MSCFMSSHKFTLFYAVKAHPTHTREQPQIPLHESCLIAHVDMRNLETVGSHLGKLCALMVLSLTREW